MGDTACIELLQWALPRLQLRWAGFRRVRRQVCKRITRRIRELGLSDEAAYRAFLKEQPAEWARLDGLCRISISRFYRDKGVFDCLGDRVLPSLARGARDGGDKILRCWSAGCACGEEPYTLAMIWRFLLAGEYPQLALRITATDTDPVLLGRARRACYALSSLKEVPPGWRASAFEVANGQYCLDPTLRSTVEFVEEDIRRTAPQGPFHLVLCRNLAFTYFDTALQRQTLEWIRCVLIEGGALVLGTHESLPEGASGFLPWAPALPIFRKAADGRAG